MRKWIGVILLLMVSATVALAQVTKVKGRVTDKDTGEGIPFAAVYLEGTTVGVSCDLDGYFAFETRDVSSNILSASLLGYETQSFVIVPGSFSEINFKLKLIENELKAAVVKPDNRYMKRILKAIDEARDRNNPDKKSTYSCKTYTKIELDLVNPQDRLFKALLPKAFHFVYDYTDTSVVSGKPYLPGLIAESTARRYHTTDPEKTGEIIEASRISGLNPTNTLKQYTGSMPLKVNFYENFINAFDVEFPSPIANSGMLFYNYFLIDSLQVDARKTYKIRFHPKKAISSPAFDGEMLIDAGDWALREIHAKMQKDGKVNWLRDVVVDVENQRLNDSTWFHGNEKIYADFSVTLRDSSKMLAMIGRREIAYSDPIIGEGALDQIDTLAGNRSKKFKVTVQEDAGFHGDAYWDAARPYSLSERERGIYQMVDSVQNAPTYKAMYKLINMFATGYLDAKYIGFGTYYNLFSFNDVEGPRLRLGFRTTKETSRKVRLTGYTAYGFRDKQWKGGGTLEVMFGSQPFRKLTFEGGYDMAQLGKGNGLIAENGSNLFNSLFAIAGRRKYSPVLRAEVYYTHEFTEGVTGNFSLEHFTYYANKHVPLILPDGRSLKSISANRLHLQARLSWGESFTRGIFDKTNFYSKYPVVTIDVIGALKGITPRDYSYLTTEVTMDWKLRLPPVGTSKIRLNGGHIQGKLPYLMLKLHEGNGNWFYDGNSFSCMNPYEFVSDSWVTLFWEHNFGGFFLGKIPGIKKLQLQEVFTLRTTYGYLSKQNRDGMVMMFPPGLHELKYPYVEVGAGITNILRMFRVDCFFRLTHGFKVAFNFGVDIKF